MTTLTSENPDPAGEKLDWQEQPERICPVTGKSRQRFYWPTNYKTPSRKWYKKDGSTALERAEAKRQAKAEAKPVFEGSRQLAERLDRETTATQED
jgi:hypothetical protein